MSFDPEAVSAVIIECAEKYILPRYKKLADHEIRTKTGPGDLVTQADMDVEEHLKRVLPGFYPGSVVVGEEGVLSGAISTDALKDDSAIVWVVDPVDGTHNFAHGKREFGVMLALVRNGVTEAGWIYDVLGKEMAVAQRGQGAFIGETRLWTSPETAPEKLTGYVSLKFMPKEHHERLKEARKQFKNATPLFCAAHEYLNIARGKANFSLYSRIKPWDHLAGSLMVAEAGGHVTKWDGTPYAPKDPDGGIIAAGNEGVWNEICMKFIKPFF